MSGKLSGETGHDFCFWKVKRHVGNDKPIQGLCLRLGTHEYHRISLRLQISPTFVFRRLHNIRM